MDYFYFIMVSLKKLTKLTSLRKATKTNYPHYLSQCMKSFWPLKIVKNYKSHFHYHHTYCVNSIETFPAAEIPACCYQQHVSRLGDHCGIWTTKSWNMLCADEAWGEVDVCFMAVARQLSLVRYRGQISCSSIWPRITSETWYSFIVITQQYVVITNRVSGTCRINRI